MLSPYKGRFRVTQLFSGQHDGLDIVGIDSKNIYSTVEGVVEKAGWENVLDRKKGFGLYVRIKKDGSLDKYYFGHLSEVMVKAGDRVSVGSLIGVEGNTGYSFGSHCHYCVRGEGSKSQVRDITQISGIPNVIGSYEGDVGNTPNVFYCARTYGRWLPTVKNLEDFAGIKGDPITDIAIKVSDGYLKYRVHTFNGKWLPYVTGFNLSDSVNGYAGNGTPIDAIEVIYSAENNFKMQCRVSPLNKEYYSWQINNEKTGGQDGYAGKFGKKIDRVQINII